MIVEITLSEDWRLAAEYEGAKRLGIHRGNPNTRAWSEDREVRGAMGECAAHEYLGLMAPWRIETRTGDGGFEFILGKQTMDVKTANSAVWLLDAIKKPLTADIAILAEWKSGPTVKLMGWEYKAAILSAPVRFVTNDDCHWINAGELKPMAELKANVIRYMMSVIDHDNQGEV